MYPLQNRVIVITGASGGMGRVLCRRLAQEGALLALTSNDAPAMEALLKDLPQNTLARVFDIADERQVAAFFAEIRETFGGADALLNLAGLSIPAQIAEMAVEDDYGMIDGILNNGQRQPPQRELPEKRKSVVEQLKSQPKPEHKKTAPKKSAEREI